VTANTVGTSGDPVRVPLISLKNANGSNNNFAWWVGDLGIKGLVAAAKPIPSGVAEIRTDQQAAPAFHMNRAASGP